MSSFSPFDVLMDMIENTSSSNNSNEQGQQNAQQREDINNDSSAGSTVDVAASFDDSLTFDSYTLNEFGGIVSMASVLQSNQSSASSSSSHSDYEGQTIVSSQDSGVYIPPPEASQEIWAISPHPGLVASSAQSLSTVCTDSVSFRDRNITTCPPSNEEDDNSLPLPQGEDKSKNTINSAAEALMSVIEPRQKLLPIPPAPLATPSSEDVSEISYCAEDYVPENFICQICKDVIVGALSLNCNCSSSTVCCSCWEAQSTTTTTTNTTTTSSSSSQQQKGFSDKLGYVWVPSTSSCSPCPSCNAAVKSIIPCHALDVAIFQILINLPVRDDGAKSLKSCYNSRLEVWRQTVIERNERQSQREEERRDEMLARYLQEEEDYFRGTAKKCKEKAMSRNDTLLFWGQAAIAALVAAAVASMGFRAVKAKR